jgi:hypothetical protein
VVEHYGVSVVQSVGSTKCEVYPRFSICVILKMGYKGCGNPISSIWQCQCANAWLPVPLGKVVQHFFASREILRHPRESNNIWVWSWACSGLVCTVSPGLIDLLLLGFATVTTMTQFLIDII